MRRAQIDHLFLLGQQVNQEGETTGKGKKSTLRPSKDHSIKRTGKLVLETHCFVVQV
jgi:hypothetical protein